MELAEIKNWRENAPDFLYADDLRPAANVFKIIDTLIAAVESLTAEKEAAERKSSEVLSAKSVTIVPPAMPESELVSHLQKNISDLQVDRHRMQSSLAQAREEIAKLEKENTELRVSASEESYNLMLAEQREKGLVEALESIHSDVHCSNFIRMKAKAALAAASKEEAC